MDFLVNSRKLVYQDGLGSILRTRAIPEHHPKRGDDMTTSYKGDADAARLLLVADELGLDVRLAPDASCLLFHSHGSACPSRADIDAWLALARPLMGRVVMLLKDNAGATERACRTARATAKGAR